VDPNVVEPGMMLQYDICPGKPKGQLLLDLDIGKLGFAGLDFHTTITGTHQGSNSESIVWKVDQEINKHLAAFDVTLERITGQFVTKVTAIEPSVKGALCGGGDRYYGAILTTSGQNNSFVLTLKKDILGVSQSGTVTVEDFTLEAVVGEPLELDVRVRVPGTPCDKPLVEGGRGEAFAITSGIPFGVKEAYHWRVEGGVPLSATDQWNLRFSIPTTKPVYVSVDVTAGDQSVFDSEMVLPIPASNLPLLTIICSEVPRVCRRAVSVS
jgi:hypothetical protein